MRHRPCDDSKFHHYNTARGLGRRLAPPPPEAVQEAVRPPPRRRGRGRRRRGGRRRRRGGRRRAGMPPPKTEATALLPAQAAPPDGDEHPRTERWLPLGDAAAVGLFKNCFGDAASLVERRAFEALGGFTEDGGVGHEDWRYSDMRRTFGRHFWWASLFSVCLGQATFLFRACLSLYGVLCAPEPLTATDAAS